MKTKTITICPVKIKAIIIFPSKFTLSVRKRKGIFYEWGINLFGLVVIKEKK